MKGWTRPFDDPIPLPEGGKLATLEDAARYIQNLPKAEQLKPHWQLAVETLINTAEGRDFLFHANIAVRKALNHGKPKPERERKRAKVYRIVQ
jgi:hypothetical protein